VQFKETGDIEHTRNRQTKHENRKQNKAKKMSNTDPTKKTNGELRCPRMV